MDRAVQINVTSHYGPMPRVETEYWKLASGPAWAWWVLAILPLDTLAQVGIFVFLEHSSFIYNMGSRKYGWAKTLPLVLNETENITWWEGVVVLIFVFCFKSDQYSVSVPLHEIGIKTTTLSLIIEKMGLRYWRFELLWIKIYQTKVFKNSYV